MTNNSVTLFLDRFFEACTTLQITDYLDKNYTSDLVCHYKAQQFNLAQFKAQLNYLPKYLEKICFTIEDLVVIDDLVTTILKIAWLDQKFKHYHELTLNLVYKVHGQQVKEMWLMPDQKVKLNLGNQFNLTQLLEQFIVNEKDKLDFLRRLNNKQSFYQDQWEPLTATEKECLYYYLNGFSSKEAALQLGLTYRTVETYIAKIKLKFTSQTRTDLRAKLFPQESGRY